MKKGQAILTSILAAAMLLLSAGCKTHVEAKPAAVKYEVHHMEENAEDSGFTEDEGLRQTLTGNRGESTRAEAKTIPGFTAGEFDQKTLTSGGDNDIYIYYTRITITITFDLDGGDGTESISGKYGSATGFESEPEKAGYVFAGWEPGLPETFPLEDITVKALWNKGDKTPYRVEHYFQDIDDDGYTLSELKTETRFGVTEETTAAEALDEEGFTAEDIEQETIAADGSTVVRIRYTRNSYTLTFDTDGGSVIDPITAKYGSTITVPPVPEKTGYVFAGWDRTVPATMPSEDMTFTAGWTAGTSTAYRIEHWQQNITDDGYTDVPSDAQTRTGTTGTETSAAALEYEGFTVRDFEQETIAADGSTVVRIYYDRNEYQLSFDPDGGSTVPPIKGRFGAAVSGPVNPAKTGYVFSRWDRQIPGTIPAEDMLFKAVWTPATGTAYTVNHYQQNIEDDGYPEIPTDTEVLYGTTGTVTAAGPKDYEGFTAGTVAQETIAADGSTAIRIDYTRNIYTLTFDASGGSTVPSITGKYGSDVAAPADPTRTGYVFAGWNKAIPSTMPSEDSAFTAVWTAGKDTVYKVEHWLQDIEDDGYTAAAGDTETKTGTTGSATAAAAKDYPGFRADAVVQGTIAADGSTVVRINYTREQHTLTFNTDGGSQIPSITGKYGAPVVLPASPAKAGYVFAGWDSPVPSTIPSEDAAFNAVWKPAADTEYRVCHYLQTPAGDAYEPVPEDTETMHGTTGDETTAAARDYTGFSAETFSQSTIAADGSTVIRINYTRNEYTLTFDSAGGNLISSIAGRYGAPVAAPSAPERTGYVFGSWDKAVPETMPAGDMTFTAIWTPATDTQYTVEHYQQDISDSGYPEAAHDIDFMQGTTGGTTAAGTKDYEGFTAGDVVQKEIAADGSTVVRIYYIRNEYTFRFNSNGGTAVGPIKAKYGSAIASPDTPAKTGYEFGGWDKAVPETMPAEDVVFTAEWIPCTDTAYTVEHWLQDISDDEYTLAAADTEQKTGTTGEETSAAARTYAGFTAGDAVQKTISASGNTVVRIYYTRNSYTLTFDANGGSSVEPFTARYGATVAKPANPTLTGYVFDGWNCDIPETMPDRDMSFTAAWKAATDTIYTVEHWLQDIDGDGYTQVTADTEKKAGTTEGKTAASAKTYEGFDGGSFSQEDIAADGSTVVRIYYRRNTYTLSFDTDGGSEIEAITARYGTPVAAPADPVKTGYVFGSWDRTVPSAMPPYDMSFKASWTAADGTIYAVEHYQQDIDDDGYTVVKADTARLAGTTDAMTSAEKKDYEGFTAEAFEQKTIAADGSTVVRIYYRRNTYTLSFDTDGGSEIEAITARYGAPVAAPENPVKTGYVFGSWDRTVPSTIPASDLELTAGWIPATDTSYTVEHYRQNVDGSTYPASASETDSLTGTTEAATAATARSYAGFTAEAFAQETVAADGSTVVKIHYTRNSYTLTFDASGGSQTPSVTGKYGTEVTRPEDPVKAGYVFTGWSPAIPSTIPAEDRTFTAGWTAATDTAYTVEHYIQDIEDPEYPDTPEDTDRRTGTTGKTTSAAAKAYAGFTAGTVTQETIAADGSTVVKIYYTRNSYTLTFDTDGGSPAAPVTGKYGAEAARPEDPVKAGYVFTGWSPAIPSTIPAGDATYTAQWTPATDTAYTVEHYRQNADGSTYPASASETESMAGTTEEYTSAAARTYAGFTAGTVVQDKIAADGSTVVKIYYTRNRYRVEYDPNGGYGTMSRTLIYYGADAELSGNTFTRSGYSFSGWNTEADGSGAPYAGRASYTQDEPGDVTLYAQWTANSASIAIELPSGENIDVAITSSVDGDLVTFTVDAVPGAEYTWLIDSVKIEGGTSETVTIDTSSLGCGKHEVMIAVKKGNRYHTAKAVLSVAR